MSLLITLTGFIILFLLTLVAKKSLLVSAAITLLSIIVISSLLDIVTLPDIVQAGFYGMFTTIEISLLIFGALAFFNYLNEGDFVQQLEQSMKQFSTNKLVITILLVLFFGSFLEGISGFGTPAMIIAPLLLALGFPSYLAATLPLLANTVPVIFGAVGTPVKIGFVDLPVGQVPVYAAIMMLLPAMMLPLLFKRYLLKSNLLLPADSNSKTYWIALGAGLAFALPFILFSFLGPEFPTLLTSITGLLVWLTFIRKIKYPGVSLKATSMLEFFQTFKPYLFIAALLLAGKLVLQNKGIVIEWPAIGLKKSIAFFQPGLFFIAGIFALNFYSRKKAPVSLKPVFRQTLSKLPAVTGTVMCLAVLARILSRHLSITELLGAASTLPHFVFYALAILTGLLGSFMTGSATMSNLLFGTQWYHIGLQCQLPLALLLACQLTGAAIGNAISLQNIVMIQAVLKEDNLDKVIFKKIGKSIVLLFVLVFGTAVLIDLLRGE